MAWFTHVCESLWWACTFIWGSVGYWVIKADFSHIDYGCSTTFTLQQAILGMFSGQFQRYMREQVGTCKASCGLGLISWVKPMGGFEDWVWRLKGWRNRSCVFSEMNYRITWQKSWKRDRWRIGTVSLPQIDYVAECATGDTYLSEGVGVSFVAGLSQCLSSCLPSLRRTTCKGLLASYSDISFFFIFFIFFFFLSYQAQISFFCLFWSNVSWRRTWTST